MPPYASPIHVHALNAARVYTATSKPSATQLDGFLAQIAGEIDGILTAQGYALPVATTATAALKMLELYNARGAWALAERAAPSSPHRDDAEQLWKDTLCALRDGKVELPGAGRDTTTAHPRGGGVGSSVFTQTMSL